MNEEVEKRLFEYLKEYYQDKFNHFVHKDKPDFQNKIDNIGVEITEATTSELGKKNSFSNKALKCKNQQEVDKLSDGIFKGEYKDNIIYNPQNVPHVFWDVGNPDSEYPYCENLIYDAILKKLEKFNKKNLYQIFKTNVLLILCNNVFLGENCADIGYIQTKIVNNIKEIEKRYDRNFDEYLFLRLTNPVMLFVIDKEYKVTLHNIKN